MADNPTNEQVLSGTNAQGGVAVPGALIQTSPMVLEHPIDPTVLINNGINNNGQTIRGQSLVDQSVGSQMVPPAVNNIDSTVLVNSQPTGQASPSLIQETPLANVSSVAQVPEVVTNLGDEAVVLKNAGDQTLPATELVDNGAGTQSTQQNAPGQQAPGQTLPSVLPVQTQLTPQRGKLFGPPPPTPEQRQELEKQAMGFVKDVSTSGGGKKASGRGKAMKGVLAGLLVVVLGSGMYVGIQMLQVPGSQDDRSRAASRSVPPTCQNSLGLSIGNDCDEQGWCEPEQFNFKPVGTEVDPQGKYISAYNVFQGETVSFTVEVINHTSSPVTDKLYLEAVQVLESPSGTVVDETTSITERQMWENHIAGDTQCYSGGPDCVLHLDPNTDNWPEFTIPAGETQGVTGSWTPTTDQCGLYQLDMLIKSFYEEKLYDDPDRCHDSYEVASGFIRVIGCDVTPTPTLTPTLTPTPSPTGLPSPTPTGVQLVCNSECSRNVGSPACPEGLSCLCPPGMNCVGMNGFCRNPQCSDQADCRCDLVCEELSYLVNGVPVTVIPKLGDTVNLVCEAGGGVIDHYNFQYSIDGGSTYLPLGSSDSGRYDKLIDNPGKWVFRCQACVTGNNEICTPWGSLSIVD